MRMRQAYSWTDGRTFCQASLVNTAATVASVLGKKLLHLPPLIRAKQIIVDRGEPSLAQSQPKWSKPAAWENSASSHIVRASNAQQMLSHARSSASQPAGKLTNQMLNQMTNEWAAAAATEAATARLQLWQKCTKGSVSLMMALLHYAWLRFQWIRAHKYAYTRGERTSVTQKDFQIKQLYANIWQFEDKCKILQLF